MGRKNAGTGKETLPSFLSSIPQRAKGPTPKPLPKSNADFAGPIFFGGCSQYHPKPHSLAPPSRFAHFTEIESEENIWDNLFRDVSPVIKTYPRRKHLRLVRKQSDVVDVWPHRAPGVRVAAGHGKRKFVPDFGKSTSRIKGETVREIACEIPADSSVRPCEREFQQKRKRALLEKGRKFLPPEKRAAHFHFPKEFVNAIIVGPPIPASLTITQFQSTEDMVDERMEEVAAAMESLGEEDSAVLEDDGEFGTIGDASSQHTDCQDT